MFKVIVIGDTTVGKSCAMRQFTSKGLKDIDEPTIGVEFGTKTISINGSKIQLLIWDTAGQENFRSITRSYYKSAACVLLVYDITRRGTFDHVVQWIDDLNEYGGNNTSIILVANKCDLDHIRQVATEEGDALAKECSMMFIEVSAKTGENLTEAFSQVTESFLDKINSGMVNREHYTPRSSELSLFRRSKGSKKKGSCC